MSNGRRFKRWGLKLLGAVLSLLSIGFLAQGVVLVWVYYSHEWLEVERAYSANALALFFAAGSLGLGGIGFVVGINLIVSRDD